MRPRLLVVGVLGLAVVVAAALWLGSDDDPDAAAPAEANGVDEDAAESPEGFLPVLSAAIRTGDEGFLFDRLHPVVVDVYGERACRVYLRDFVVPNSEFRFRSAAEPTEFTWIADGMATLVQDVVNVDVTAVSEEGEIDRVIHLGLVEGSLRWFADCGDPVV
jgi:hypothetical protein